MCVMEKDKEFWGWIEGIPYELAFWNNTYRWNTSFDGLMHWSRIGKSIQLGGFDAPAFLAGFDRPVVLDVGCGMSYAFGDHVETSDGMQPLEMHYIDPLASFYNKIKERYHRDMPDIEFGMMENLSITHSNKGAKLIIISNALDHSSNPMRGILDALNVLDVGGCLYLNHHPNEAEAEHYKGFHKYNICMNKAHQMVIWNREKRIIVDDIIAPFAMMETKTLENGFVVSVITKKSALDESVDPQEANKEAYVHKLMVLLEVPQCLSFTLKMKMKYAWYNTIQFFVQMLPYKYKRRMRNLIYR